MVDILDLRKTTTSPELSLTVKNSFSPVNVSTDTLPGDKRIFNSSVPSSDRGSILRKSSRILKVEASKTFVSFSKLPTSNFQLPRLEAV